MTDSGAYVDSPNLSQLQFVDLLLASPAPIHTSAPLIQNTYSTVHSPVMFTAAVNSSTPNASPRSSSSITAADDPWGNIFKTIKNDDNFRACFSDKVSIEQNSKKVHLTFSQSHLLTPITEDTLDSFALAIQKQAKEKINDVEVNFPQIIFIFDSSVEAKQFVKYLLERSGLTVEKAAESSLQSNMQSPAQHDKSVNFSTQQ